mgnify:CR=1 FL=1
MRILEASQPSSIETRAKRLTAGQHKRQRRQESYATDGCIPGSSFRSMMSMP